MKAQFAEISQRTGLYADAERTYVHDEQGRIVERHMHMGPISEDIVRSYNDRGNVAEQTWGTSGLPHELNGQPEPQLKCGYVYEYDVYGNWTSRVETSKVGENTTTHAQTRQLTYYS